MNHTAFVVAEVGLFLVLRLWGPSLAVVYTPSMVPTYSPGDVVVIMKSLTPGIGDIATFTAPLTPAGDHRIPVSHRIIGQDERGFITKGDATPQDWWRVPSSDLTGQVVASFPRVWIFRVAAILIGLAVLLMLWPKDEGPQPGTVAWWRRRLGGEEPWLREQPFGLREVESR